MAIALLKILKSRVLTSGDRVPETGVYRALHSTPHALIQHEIHFVGAKFRGCGLCPLGVLYRLDKECVPKSAICSDRVSAMAY
jgi:hypothetical protein